MSFRPYPTDLSEEQWRLIASLIPPAKTGGRFISSILLKGADYPAAILKATQ